MLSIMVDRNKPLLHEEHSIDKGPEIYPERNENEHESQDYPDFNHLDLDLDLELILEINSHSIGMLKENVVILSRPRSNIVVEKYNGPNNTYLCRVILHA